MATKFQVLTDLPSATQIEIARIQAISSANRKTFESNFLSNYNDYIKNEVLQRDSAGNVMLARGVTVPQGLAGFASGAVFFIRDATAGQLSIWENTGDTSSSVFVQANSILPISLSSAQILALKTTPVAIVPAPGVGKKVIVDEIILLNTFGAAAYNGANNIEARYTNGSGAKVTADFDKTAFLGISSGTAYAVNKAVATSLVPVDNAAVVLAVPSADPTTGDGVITGFVRYHVVTL